MSADAQALYEEVVSEITATTPAVPAKMFGAPCLMMDRKAFACFTRGGMVFKLANPRHAEALKLPGAHLFDPGGMGRPMKEWVWVPVEHAGLWTELAHEALNYIISLNTRNQPR